METRTVQATPPDEPGWSFAALRMAFGAALSRWMYKRFRVHSSDVDDAIQDTLFEAWRDLAAFPADREKARYEMVRVASRVAQRYRRQAARMICVDALEVRDSRDVEADIASRVLWLEALFRLDERTRDLLLVYHIDERTQKQIGADLGISEEAVRKRIGVAEKKLRYEIEKLLGKEDNRKGLSTSAGFVIVFDPFDRATIRAILDVEDEFGVDTSPASSLRPKVKTNSWPWQCVPLGVLAAALFFLPGQGWRTEALYAAKIGNIPLPAIALRSVAPVHNEIPRQTPEPLPRKTDRRDRPTLNAHDAAIVKKLGQLDAGSYTPH